MKDKKFLGAVKGHKDTINGILQSTYGLDYEAFVIALIMVEKDVDVDYAIEVYDYMMENNYFTGLFDINSVIEEMDGRND